MGRRSHYDTLGVDRDATRKEIRSAFLALSKETHPDVGGATADAEKFKEVSVAASILTNDRKREAYDRELEDDMRSPFGGGFGHQHHRPSGQRRRHPHQPGGAGGRPTTNFGIFVSNIMRPRTFVIGFASVFALGFATTALFGPKQPNIREGRDVVQAWKNPSTGNYEQPAPWDPVYRKLKPALVLVPREEVQRRQR